MTLLNCGDKYELHQLTDNELITFTRQQNSAAWHGLLTAEQYVEREGVLHKSKITSLKKNKLYVFMLTEKNNMDVRVSLIELLVRNLWKYTSDKSGKVRRQDVLSGCIGGVYTYPEARGKGVAKIMVDLLVERAKKDIVGPDGFLFLYLEIGEYYTRCGFKSFEVPLVQIDLPTIKNANSSKYQVKYIKYHDFDEELELYNRQVDEKYRALTENDGKTRVSLAPMLDLVDWFHLRAKFIAAKLFHLDEFDFDMRQDNYDEIVKKFKLIQPDTFGLTLLEDGFNLATIVWTYDWEESDNGFSTKVTVLKTIIHDQLQSECLQEALLVELVNYLKTGYHPAFQNYKKLVLWESEFSRSVVDWLVRTYGAKDGMENSSRSAILLNDVEDNDKLLSGDLIWEGNDKLPWF